MLTHHFGYTKLPSKAGRFDWSLGPGVSAIARNHEADYALFVYYRDYQASGGRIAFAILAAAAGYSTSTGSEHGFASLVDLKTGDIVCRVAGDYCNDFRVYIIRNPSFNASMTATGMMQIWTGLIVRANSTDEIAAVVGHEIAHYTRLHSLQRLRDMKAKLAAGSIFDIAVILATGYSTPLGQMTAMMTPRRLPTRNYSTF